jgi:hypothetical protein
VGVVEVGGTVGVVEVGGVIDELSFFVQEKSIKIPKEKNRFFII